MDGSQPTWESLGVAGAMMREYQKDQAAFFELLAQVLTSAFGARAKAITAGGFLSKKTLAAIELADGDWIYRIEKNRFGELIASRQHIVREVALKTESIEVPLWLEEISLALQARSEANEASRKAVAELLGLL